MTEAGSGSYITKTPNSVHSLYPVHNPDQDDKNQNWYRYSRDLVANLSFVALKPGSCTYFISMIGPLILSERCPEVTDIYIHHAGERVMTTNDPRLFALTGHWTFLLEQCPVNWIAPLDLFPYIMCDQWRFMRLICISVYGSLLMYVWTASSEFGTYRQCEQRRFRRACASAQSRQNLRCSLIQAVSQEEVSDRKPDPWPLWMAGHAQLNLSWRSARRHKFAWRGYMF